MKILMTASAALLLATTAATAQTATGSAHADAPHAVVVLPGSIEWSAGPPSLPAGARVAILEGDPSQPGPFTLRLSMPAGYRIPPHFHPSDERVTVISGSFWVGMGNAFDTSAGTQLPAGAYAALSPGVAHFAWTTEESVIQLNNIGPWSLTYVNPADDPRTQDR